MNKLAKAIYVDNSLVNRWVNEKRIPPLSSPYLEKIADFLSTCIVSTYQNRLLEEMFSQLEINDKLRPMNNKEKIHQLF